MPERPATVYAITTPRLVMRCVDPADAPVFRALAVKNADRLARWQDPALFASQAAVLEWLRRGRSGFDAGQFFSFTIALHAGPTIGFGSIDPRHPAGGFEISGWFDSDHEGEGYAYEGSSALTRISFEHYGARRVEMYCEPDNQRVHRLLERLGYRHEATLRRRVERDGGLHDRMVWAVHDSEYPGTPPSACELLACDALGAPVFASEPAPRPPPGSPWGRDAFTWQELLDHLARRYPGGEVAATRAALVVRVSHQGETAEQRIEVQLGSVLDQPVLVVAAPVGAEAELELREALLHNGSLAIGALALIDGGYQLRQGLALAGLTGAALDQVVLLLAHEAVRLRTGARVGADGSQLYAWLAGPGDGPA